MFEILDASTIVHLSKINVRPISSPDREWLSNIMRKNWGADIVVSRGRIHDTRQLEGFLVEKDGKRAGELTYNIDREELEVVTLTSRVERSGVGSALLEATRQKATSLGCHRLWLITTNDNTDALRFYQKRGLRLVAIHVNALEQSRKLKPSISLIGRDGIPLRDEIELELPLVEKQ